MSDNSRTFVVLNDIVMKATDTTYLVKEHVTGFVMVAGTLKGQVFKARNGKLTINLDKHLLSKDERFFTHADSARRHIDMLNNVII